ncbi:MAG TPA: rod shape-determining protein MreC [Vicinamibacterales bacterium]|jgi:rod shape-determining protein MreC|nr:rod shape-determining protein MreC [Vicinamibacterales bacterium]
MALTDIRPRAGSLFLAVMLGHMILISSQVVSRRGGSMLETFTVAIFSEVQRGVSSPVSGVRNAWSGYVGLRRVKMENDQLKRQLADAEVALQEQRAIADRARGLEQLLELRDRSNLHTTAAEIIGASATPDFRTVTIDKGGRDGVRSEMAVIAPLGVVGRVVVSAPRSAKVQLLVDHNAGAGAIIERSRAQGIVMGSGDNLLRMEYVSEVFDVNKGDDVVTSGIEGIYPKGFAIGQVESVEKVGGAYKRITIRPAVDFSSLEQVLVVLTATPTHETMNPAERAPE